MCIYLHHQRETRTRGMRSTHICAYLSISLTRRGRRNLRRRPHQSITKTRASVLYVYIFILSGRQHHDIYLSIYLFIYLSIYPSIYLYMYIYIYSVALGPVILVDLKQEQRRYI